MSETDSESIIKFLGQVPFFSGVAGDSLKDLCTNCILESYIKGETIFKKGSLGDTMYVIIEGKVKVFENDHIFDTLTAGDCFGEYALIDSKPRSASVGALEKTKVLKIERQHFLDLMSENTSFAQSILSVMIERHRALDDIQERLASSKHELEFANNKMNGIIQGAMDAIIMFDNKFKIILTNTAANTFLENEDVIQRNILFFMDEESADLIEKTVEKEDNLTSKYLKKIIKVYGTNDRVTLTEGTISKSGNEDEPFYTLILRNIEERLNAEDTINLLTKQTEYLEEEIKELTSSYGIIAENERMKMVLNLIQQVAKTDATVLIQGETGTGKELVARAIHQESNRNDKPLIRINCGAIPANLIESELFGHEKGAFTGATSSRKGRFLLADKGTIFLDEIGEMPIELQPKLLRVIQEGEFDPVGSSETIKVDVRIIAATHRDLLSFSQTGKFREDLYYRLNVFPLKVPALRERGNDICLIADQMIEQFSKKLGKPIPNLDDHDKTLLKEYSWPGNVRELQNLVERAVIVAQNGQINWQAIIPNQRNSQAPSVEIKKEQILTAKDIIDLERENILKALKETRWKISGHHGAAELLQIPPTTLASKIKALGIERPI